MSLVFATALAPFSFLLYLAPLSFSHLCVCVCVCVCVSSAFYFLRYQQANKDTQNSNSSSSDFSKKEEFKRYLEKTGVLDALTKVLVGLYEEPERPINAIDYIKKYIGAPPNVDVEGLKRENEQLKAELEKLKKQNPPKSSKAAS